MKKENKVLKGKNSSQVNQDNYHVLLNEKEASEFLGLSVRSLQQRRYQSLSPSYIKLPNSSAVRYRRSVLIEYVAEGEVDVDSRSA